MISTEAKIQYHKSKIYWAGVRIGNLENEIEYHLRTIMKLENNDKNK